MFGTANYAATWSNWSSHPHRQSTRITLFVQGWKGESLLTGFEDHLEARISNLKRTFTDQMNSRFLCAVWWKKQCMSGSLAQRFHWTTEQFYLGSLTLSLSLWRRFYWSLACARKFHSFGASKDGRASCPAPPSVRKHRWTSLEDEFERMT